VETFSQPDADALAAWFAQWAGLREWTLSVEAGVALPSWVKDGRDEELLGRTQVHEERRWAKIWIVWPHDDDGQPADWRHTLMHELVHVVQFDVGLEAGYNVRAEWWIDQLATLLLREYDRCPVS